MIPSTRVPVWGDDYLENWSIRSTAAFEDEPAVDLREMILQAIAAGIEANDSGELEAWTQDAGDGRPAWFALAAAIADRAFLALARTQGYVLNRADVDQAVGATTEELGKRSIEEIAEVDGNWRHRFAWPDGHWLAFERPAELSLFTGKATEVRKDGPSAAAYRQLTGERPSMPYDEAAGSAGPKPVVPKAKPTNERDETRTLRPWTEPMKVPSVEAVGPPKGDDGRPSPGDDHGGGERDGPSAEEEGVGPLGFEPPACGPGDGTSCACGLREGHPPEPKADLPFELEEAEFAREAFRAPPAPIAPPKPSSLDGAIATPCNQAHPEQKSLATVDVPPEDLEHSLAECNSPTMEELLGETLPEAPLPTDGLTDDEKTERSSILGALLREAVGADVLRQARGLGIAELRDLAMGYTPEHGVRLVHCRSCPARWMTPAGNTIHGCGVCDKPPGPDSLRVTVLGLPYAWKEEVDAGASGASASSPTEAAIADLGDDDTVTRRDGTADEVPSTKRSGPMIFDDPPEYAETLLLKGNRVDLGTEDGLTGDQVCAVCGGLLEIGMRVYLEAQVGGGWLAGHETCVVRAVEPGWRAGRIEDEQMPAYPLDGKNPGDYCEWSPEDRAVKGGDPFHGYAEVLVGAKGQWRVCRGCLKAKKFARFRKVVEIERKEPA